MTDEILYQVAYNVCDKYLVSVIRNLHNFQRNIEITGSPGKRQ